jgi:MFS family permease
LGVFVDPLHAAFGWSVSQVQIGLTISYLTTMAILPAVGALADRVGVRAVALGSLTGLGLAFMALSLQRGQLWAFWLNWFFISLFGTGTLAITWTRPLTHAFRAGRGLALGLSLLGTGVIGIFGPPAARALIDAVGWRWAYVCLGAAPILIAVPTTLLFFRDPAPTTSHGSKGLPASLRDPRLWLLGVAFLLIAGGVSGTITNLIKAVTAEGVSRADAVAAASLVGLFVIVGRVSCGALIDRFWAPGVAAIFVMMPATACALLAGGPARPGVAAISAALIGLTAGAEFDLLPFLIGRYLPLRRYTGSLAVSSACFYLGAAAGGPLLAMVYDRLGSYRLGLWGASGLFAVAAVALVCLGPYPVFESVSASSRPETE